MQVSDRINAIEQFKDRKFGLFMHWGLYSILGRGEWVQYIENIPTPEYEKLAAQFRGEKFDADSVARLAIDAGMKYIVLTAKHHDGFCLFDSKLTDYTTTKTAAGRDFISEIAEACHKHGLGFHPYYSLWDWHHPDFVPDDPDRWQGYLDYYHGQVSELCTNYGPVVGMWFDRGGGYQFDYDFGATAAIANELQPDAAIMCADYWVGEKSGQPSADGRPRLGGFAVSTLNTGPYEVCETVNDHYCCCPTDHNFKSTAYLWHYLMEVVGHDGNFLLNIGPQPDGTIDRESEDSLRSLGRLMARYGKAIYGTRAAIHPRINPNGHTLTRGSRAFFFITNLTPLLDSMLPGRDPLNSTEGSAKVEFNGIRSTVTSMKPLDGKSLLPFEQDGTRLTVTVPRAAMSWPQFVIEADMDGTAEIDGDIRPEPDGSFLLSPEWAAIYTPTPMCPRYFPSEGGLGRIGWWSESRAKVEWLLRVPEPGRYEVTIDQACAGTAASAVGTPYQLVVKESALQISSIIDHSTNEPIKEDPDGPPRKMAVLTSTVQPTASWTDFVSMPLGEVDLSEGLTTVELASKGDAKAFMDVRSVRFVRCPEPLRR